MVQLLLPDSNPLPQDWLSYPSGRSHGAVDDGAASHDSDATYLYATSNGEQCLLTLDNGTDPATDGGHVVRVVHRMFKDTGAVSITGTTVEVLQGSTVIASRELAVPTTSYVTEAFTLTEAEASGISDYADLKLRLTAGVFALSLGATYAEHRVTALELELPASGVTGGAAPLAVTAAATLAAAASTGGSAQVRVNAAGSLGGFEAGDVFFPAPGYDAVSYVSGTSGVPAHPIHRLSIFLPTGTAPAGGWPAVVQPLLTAYVSSNLPASIDSSTTWHRWLARKWAVVLMSVPVARGGSSPHDVSDGSFNPSAGEYGDAYVGNGCQYPAGSPTPTGLAMHPVADPTWFMATKAFAMATQWLADGNGAAAGLNMAQIGAQGTSAGGETALTVCWSPNLAPYMFPSGTPGQDTVSTRGVYKFLIANVTPTHFGIMSPSMWIPRFSASGPPWDVPAATLGDAHATYVKLSSPLTVAQGASVAAGNALFPVRCTYGDAGTGQPPYTSSNTGGTETNGHGVWSGLAAQTLFPDAVTLVALSQAAYDVAPSLFDEFLDESVVGQQATLDANIDWAAALFGYLQNNVSASATVEVSASSGITSTGKGWLARIHDTIRGRVESALAGLSLPIQYDNEPEAPPAGATAWLRARVEHDESDLDSHDAQRGLWRRTGSLVVEARYPMGSGGEAALAAADAVVAAFRGLSLPPVEFRSPTTTQGTLTAAGDAAAGAEGAWHAVTVTVPWWSREPQPRPAAGATGPAATFEVAADAIRARFDTLVGQALSVPVVYDNAPAAWLSGAPAEVDAGTARWVRLALLPGTTVNVGGGAAGRYRTPCLAVASVFVPADSGEASALELADAIEDAFRGASASGVVMGAPGVGVPGRDGAWWSLNVRCPFWIAAPA